jgi:hypothetical protein
MATYSEAIRPYEAVLSDAGNRSYDALTIASGAGSLVAGSVVGLTTKRQAAAPIPTIVGTGSGVMSGLTFGPDVQVGSYVITLTATSATAAFTVVAPDGTALPTGNVATAYKSNHLSFLIANGGTMTLGDAFTVVVSAGGTPVLVGTGTGVVSAFSLGKYAQNGTYKVRVLATSATGAFDVIAPDGTSVGEGNIATAFASDHVNFTLANGGTMTINDYFNIIVANSATQGQGKLWDPTAVDGTQEAAGIIVNAADATSATALATLVARDAEIKSSLLTWKSTVTAAQKAEAIRQLAARQIIVRS